MSSFRYDRNGCPPTLAEYEALDLTRPLTDHGIGAHTDGRRTAGEAASAVYREPDTAINRVLARGPLQRPPAATKRIRRAHTTPEPSEEPTV